MQRKILISYQENVINFKLWKGNLNFFSTWIGLQKNLEPPQYFKQTDVKIINLNFLLLVENFLFSRSDIRSS